LSCCSWQIDRHFVIVDPNGIGAEVVQRDHGEEHA
jgi:hypothetical protein